MTKQLHLPFITKALQERDCLAAENAKLLTDSAQLGATNKLLLATNEELKAENLILQTELARVKQEISGGSTTDQSSELSPLPIAAVASPAAHYVTGTAASSSESERVKLFRNYFSGRDDVYAHQYVNQGKPDYAPARDHNWDSHVFVKAKGKKVCQKGPECPLRPMTDAVIIDHLNGKHVVGLFPLLLDSTCRLLALDFDDECWQDDVVAFLESCDQYGVSALLERSRSGRGAHVWIFFSKAIPAHQARKLGDVLITHTKANRFKLDWNSYDRVFPSQDSLPKGGFGNLIALPLQFEPSKDGNSLFIDRAMRPLGDQWAHLSSISKMAPSQLDGILLEAQKNNAVMSVGKPTWDDSKEQGEIDPWTVPPSGRKKSRLLTGPLPEKVSATISNMVYVDTDGLPSPVLTGIASIAAFQNPEFFRKQAMRKSTYETPRIISCAVQQGRYLGLPRGCVDGLEQFLSENNIRIDVNDQRYGGKEIAVNFAGELRTKQMEAISPVLLHDMGVLVAATGFGKTVLGAYVIAQRKTNTLILVNKLIILKQWRDELKRFLDLDETQIGYIGGGKDKLTGIVDVAMMQSLQERGEGSVKDLVTEYGQIIVDECHHVCAVTFERVVREAKAKYVLGLTATPRRRNGDHPIIYMQCGPLRYKTAPGHLPGYEHVVIPRFTGLQLAPTLGDENFHEVYTTLEYSERRNDMVVQDILASVKEGRSPLVISQRREHVDKLQSKLSPLVKNVIVILGGQTDKQRKRIKNTLSAIGEDEERILLATGQTIGEGFDDSRLDTLFLTLPISDQSLVEQYVGRLHRKRKGKTRVEVYDYVDESALMLLRMFDKRKKIYKKMGYKVQS